MLICGGMSCFVTEGDGGLDESWGSGNHLHSGPGLLTDELCHL